MGDFNAKIGENVSHVACGPYGIGVTNQRGELLLDWMEENSLVAVNTCFRHRMKERYTWTSPNGQYKNMIDFIIIRKRDRSEIQNSRSLVSADCDTDHQMVWARVKGRVWHKKQQSNRIKKRDYAVLGNKEIKEKFENLLKEKIKEETWPDLKKSINEALEETCPLRQEAKKPWIDGVCWKLIEERRQLRKEKPNSLEHKKASRKVKSALKRAKRKWYSERLKDAEEAQKRGDSKTIYKTIRKVTKKQSTQPGIGIKDRNGHMLFNKEDICERWREYCTELYGRLDHTQEEIEKGEEEPEVLLSEIEAAIRKLKTGKATGTDGVPSEALKAGGQTIVTILKKVIDGVWTTGVWPDEWTVSELLPLPKTPGAQDCTKYRTISLISHSSKILLEIIRQRLQYYLTQQIAEEQFGFTPGKGTTDAILAIRNIIQKVAKKQDEEEAWFMFVDYTKAFDSVFHDALWKTLLEFGVPQHLIWLVKTLYDSASGIVRVQNEVTAPFQFRKGVRQGCLISSLLSQRGRRKDYAGSRVQDARQSRKNYWRTCNLEYSVCR